MPCICKYREVNMKKDNRIKFLIIALLALLVLTVSSAIDSHNNPQRHENAVKSGWLFPWE